MVTVSLCMIVKNEEEVIGRCLSSIAGAIDEIIIVDTGSTDRTKEVVRPFTDKVIDFTWIDDFAAARNFAFGQATMEYILWLDADDVFTEKDYEEFKQLKASLAASVDSVAMKYNLAFDEYGNVTFSLRRNRLVKRSNGYRWIGAVHEYLEVWGNIVNSDIAVTHRSLHHDSDRNLNIYEKRLAEGEHFTPRDLYYFANELSDHQRFEQAIEFYEKFLATGQGWIEDVISTCGKLADCYHRLGNKDKVLESTLRTLQYDAPRAEYCCRLGFYFLSESKLEPAIYWYETALQRKPDTAGWGFQKPDYWTFIPHLQLCVCYDRKGDYKAANAHNERARSYRPEDARVMHNKRYLESRLASEE